MRPLSFTNSLCWRSVLLIFGVSLNLDGKDIEYPAAPFPEIHWGAPLSISKKDLVGDLRGGPDTTLRVDDNRYVRLEHDYLPKLLDWHTELRKNFAHIRKTDDSDLDTYTQRAAHVMRVFMGLRTFRDAGYGDAAIMLGSVRIKLPIDWGAHAAGTTLDMIFVGTDRGYFLIDPVTRTLREYDRAHQVATVWLHI